MLLNYNMVGGGGGARVYSDTSKRQTAGWEQGGTLFFPDKSQKMHMERMRESARHPLAGRREMADSGKAGAGNQDLWVLKPPLRPVVSCKGVHPSHRHV